MRTTHTKEKLIARLRDLASQKGLDRVSMGDVAKEAGISKATLFSHFKGREEMVKAMYTSFDSYGKSINLDLAGSARDVLERAVIHWLSFFTTSPMREAWRIISQQKYTEEDAFVRYKRLRGMVSSQCQAILEALSESGRMDIAEPDLASTLFSHTLLVYIEEETLHGNDEEDWKIHRLVAKFTALFTSQAEQAPPS